MKVPSFQMTLLELLKPYLGAPYVWSVDGMPASGAGAPFWYQKEVPTPEEVHAKGCCCVGLVNIALGLLGSPQRFCGTRHVWLTYGLNSIPTKQEPPPLTLLMADYQDELHQGHVGIVLEDGLFIHCYVDDPEPKEDLCFPGIVIENSWKSSDSWAKYEGWVSLV
jgi:hypothetical protein